MEFKIFIVSVACFSCVVPDINGAPFLAKAAASTAVAAAKGAVVAKLPALVKGGLALAQGGLALAKGALAFKGAAFKKAAGAIAAAFAAKGALIAKSLLAVNGVFAAKKALATKGVALAQGAVAKGAMLAKGAAAAVVAKGAAAVAAKAGAAAAAVKGATAIATAKSKAIVAAKTALGGAAVAAVGGLALSKLGALSSGRPEERVRVAFPVSHPTLEVVPIGSTASPYNRRSLTINELFYQAAEHPQVLSPVAEAAGVVGRIAGWAGAIQGALVEQSNTAADLVGALTTRVAMGSSPSPQVYQMLKSPPRFYPAPVVEKLKTVY